MGKIRCDCGYVHDLVNCPYKTGWIAVRDVEFDGLLDASIEQKALKNATSGTPDFAKLLRADEEAFAPVTYLFECPDCGRLIWRRKNDEPVRVFRLEREVD